MIKILHCKKNNYIVQINSLLEKRQNNTTSKKNIVKKIISEIKRNGDKALIKYEKKYSKNREIKINKKTVQKSYMDL